MKTKYLAEAQTAISAGQVLTNQYALDLALGFPYIGLLSSLPLEGSDGVEGLGEIFNGDPLNGYGRLPLSKGSFTSPSLIFNSTLGASGVQTSYAAEIAFNPATSDWGSILGVVVYYARTVGSTLRVTPMYSSEFISPVVITTNKKLIIPNTSNARLRLIELIRKQIIQ